mmetsp:Transcript_40909/g.80632  ORF Transcript_40909/g.80632 Transcript_40909/m.80632 type:complete len:113 (+) Transcript_40909:247-585(+)
MDVYMESTNSMRLDRSVAAGLPAFAVSWWETAPCLELTYGSACTQAGMHVCQSETKKRSSQETGSQSQQMCECMKDRTQQVSTSPETSAIQTAMHPASKCARGPAGNGWWMD